MNIALFYHSLLSDWNHGNAHFLRGIAWELRQRGHRVRVYEPANGWSLSHLVRQQGEKPLADFHRAYPGLWSRFYRLRRLDLGAALRGIDLVLVHEWNEPELVAKIGAHRKAGAGYRLLFHDTHHRSVTDPRGMARYDLSGYDGVLAFGKAVARRYLTNGWARRAWVWHEAADSRVFRPLAAFEKEYDLVWIGNWGDDERADELREFLVEPVRALRLKARVHGVRYPRAALADLERAGIEYGGWLPNFRAPALFARARLTIHVPRRHYATALPGIPTIRPFEALACGVPLVSAPWRDAEKLFTPGKEFLFADSGAAMARQIRRLLRTPERRRRLARDGRRAILERHSCSRRIDQLLEICRSIGGAPRNTSFERCG